MEKNHLVRTSGKLELQNNIIAIVHNTDPLVAFETSSIRCAKINGKPVAEVFSCFNNRGRFLSPAKVSL